MKKFLIVLFFLAMSVSAQTTARVAPACGQQDMIVTAKSETGSTTVVPADPTRATVVFIEDDGIGGSHQQYMVRIGLNGNWVGAYKGNAHFSVSVEPGEQHVCANVQSHSALGQIVALAHFEAESGKVYYFRTRFLAGLRDLYPTYSVLELD